MILFLQYFGQYPYISANDLSMHIKSIIIAVLLFNMSLVSAQTARSLYDAYPKFKEGSIDNRRFKHQDIMKVLEKLPDHLFEISKLGESIEGRDINLVKVGNGPVNVLLWSQMHGDEPTATMALMDLFHFIENPGDFQDLRADILGKLSLYFIPMLNPDGAERYTRRNANDVDLNRDALRLQNPEAQILKQIRDSLDADWGFNLHDQSRYYSAGYNPKSAGFSFLAPAYNYEKEVNEKRGDAMKLIGVMDQVLKGFVPGNVGRYSDDFEPRAFGDNIQKWGTRTILIECGSLPGDREKQELRRLHFVIFLKAFEAIANGSYQDMGLEPYENIPFNRSYAFHDLIIRKATVRNEDNAYLLDIGFRLGEIEYDQNSKFYLRAGISDVGDLHTYYAYEEFDAEGLEVVPGKVYPKKIKDLNALKRFNFNRLAKEGYLYYRLKNFPSGPDRYQTEIKENQIPVHILPRNGNANTRISLGNNPAFFLSRDGELKYAVVNGRVYPVK